MFKVGDRVICVNPVRSDEHYPLKKGSIYTVSGVQMWDNTIYLEEFGYGLWTMGQFEPCSKVHKVQRNLPEWW